MINEKLLTKVSDELAKYRRCITALEELKPIIKDNGCMLCNKKYYDILQGAYKYLYVTKSEHYFDIYLAEDRITILHISNEKLLYDGKHINARVLVGEVEKQINYYEQKIKEIELYFEADGDILDKAIDRIEELSANLIKEIENIPEAIKGFLRDYDCSDYRLNDVRYNHIRL